MKKLVIFLFSVLSFSACGGESDTAAPVVTTVSTTTAAPVVTTVSTTTAAPTSSKQIELTAVCTFDESIPQVSCQALGTTQGSQLRWESNIAGWTTGPSYEIKLVEQHQIVPEVKVTLQECQASDCKSVESMIDTSAIFSSSNEEIAPETGSLVIDPQPEVATTSQPPTTNSSPSELVASCIFDNVEHYLNCEALGGRGGSLTWSSNVPGMGTDFGSTYSRQLEWGLVLDEISVDLEECVGSECTTVTNNLDLDLQPRGSCPSTFDGWFTTFPLNEIGEIIEVEAAARLIGATFEQPGVFRLPYGQNNVEVRLPINATLAYGLKYSTVSNLNNANPEEVPELQYGLRFQTECEGLWFTIDHMQTLTPQLTSYFDDLPVESNATTKKIGPLVMQEGDLVGTTIGFPIDGNAFVAFGIFDEYERVPTAGPDFLNAVCFYDFFSSDIAAQLRAQTVDRWPVAEGLVSC
jgi:hypothetical protein